jgi:hypothetical protein
MSIQIEAVITFLKVFSWHWLINPNEITKTLRMVGSMVKIQNGYCPNASLEVYCYTSLHSKEDMSHWFTLQLILARGFYMLYCLVDSLLLAAAVGTL